MRWRFKRSAEKQFSRLTAIQQRRTLHAMDKLVETPERSDITRLRGQNDVWRLKYGDLRALFLFEDSDTVTVIWVGTRQSAERQY